MLNRRKGRGKKLYHNEGHRVRAGRGGKTPDGGFEYPGIA